MKKLRFTVERAAISPTSSSEYLDDGQEPADALVAGVLDVLGTDLFVTVGGVTQRLAAWQDPDHWDEDWSATLGIDADDVPQAVADLLGAATSE